MAVALASCVAEAADARASGPRLYRRRHPEATVHYRLVAEHLETFLRVYEERFENTYGHLRPVVRRVAEQYLDCGILKNGFARVRCDRCKAEYLLAFSCKTRNFCPSCQQKRSILWAQWLVENLLAPVPHTQWLFTIPRAIRGLFARDRRLLSHLSQTAYDSILRVFRAALEEKSARPGVVAAIQTFGDLLGFHPHLHLLVTEGAFLPDGTFLPLPFFSPTPVEEVFRRLLLHRLHRMERLSDRFFHSLLEWGSLSPSPRAGLASAPLRVRSRAYHSGFNLDNAVRVKPEEPQSLEALARYVTRAPLSLQKLSLDPATGDVLYHSKFNPRLGRDFERLDPLELLARIPSHIPDPRSHLVRYYGAYSNRGRVARAATSSSSPLPARVPKPPSETQLRSRASWARYPECHMIRSRAAAAEGRPSPRGRRARDKTGVTTSPAGASWKCDATRGKRFST
jgi:hypothetical protein